MTAAEALILVGTAAAATNVKCDADQQLVWVNVVKTAVVNQTAVKTKTAARVRIAAKITTAAKVKVEAVVIIRVVQPQLHLQLLPLLQMATPQNQIVETVVV